MMLGYGVALKGCATRPGKPASALDRDAVAKQVACHSVYGGMRIGSRIAIDPSALM
jgi:hypothetical protein